MKIGNISGEVTRLLSILKVHSNISGFCSGLVPLYEIFLLE